MPVPLSRKIAIALLAASTLGLEVALTRVLSVSLWYHFAFLVVSTAVLGFGLSGAALIAWPSLRRRPSLAALAGAYGISVVAAHALLQHVPFEPFRMLAEPRQMGLALVVYALLAAPFLLAGLCVGRMLGDAAADVGRLYGFDLAGAGAGAMGIVLAFESLGGSGTVLATAVLGLVAAAALGGSRTSRALWGGLAITVLAVAPSADRLIPVRIASAKQAARGVSMQELLADPARNLHTEWNALSRIDLVQGDGARVILIDGGVALTRLPLAGAPLPADVTGLATGLTPGERVLVIGSGGGWEVRAALEAGASLVDAVEINPAINRLLVSQAAHAGDLLADPRVRLHEDEGRSFLRRSAERWDLVLLAHTISNAATATGALSLAESYTLTREALADDLDHLTPGGVVYFTRPRRQIDRLVATARDALLARGAADPGAHLFAVESVIGADPSFSAGLLVAREPLPAERIAELRRRAQALELAEVWPAAPSSSVAAVLRGEPVPGERTDPVSDDRPFFHQRSRWRDLDAAAVRRVLRRGASARTGLEEAPVAEVSLLVLLLQAGLLTAAFAAFVLLRRAHRGTPRGTVLLLFGALGAGFMFAELGLIHALTLFVGPPTLAFAAVLGGLLVASGIGARLSGRIAREPLAFLAVALTLGLSAAVIPAVTSAALGLPIAARVAIAVLLVVPAGLALGLPFPLSLRRCEARAPSLFPAAWGVNGLASVLGSVACLVLATAAGFTEVLLAGAAVYAAGAVIVRRL